MTSPNGIGDTGHAGVGDRISARMLARSPALTLTLALSFALLLAVGIRATSASASWPAVTHGGGASWQRIETSGLRGEVPIAVAHHFATAGLAVADNAGVSLWRGSRRDRVSLVAVRDLAFSSDGVLWIATATGLYRWDEADRPTRRRLAGGEAANRIHRLGAGEAGLLVATGAGAFWSTRGEIFQALGGDAVGWPVTRAVFEATRGNARATSGSETSSVLEARVWIYGESRLHRIRGLVTDAGLRVLDARPLSLPRPQSGVEPVDLVVDPAGSFLYLVYPDLIAARPIVPLSTSSDVSGAGAARPPAESWHFLRPVLPPGAEIRRVGWGSDRVWIATDHGLLGAPTLEGPFRRAESPLGNAPCADLDVTRSGSTVALCRDEVYAWGAGSDEIRSSAVGLGREGAGVAADSEAGAPQIGDPPLVEIRRRALERAGLGVERSERMRRGLRRRAYWPELSLRAGADFDRDRSRDWDQSFVSGDTRDLYDHSRDRGESFAVAIDLEWDLGGLAYPEDSVDLSRELRQVVSLRDDVADEINQLYFERKRIRARLADEASTLSREEREALRLRARELEAGLDAWTGGWVSRWKAARRDAPSRGSIPEFRGPDHPDERKNEW